MARHRQREGAAEISLDQRERQIDPRRDPRRRPDRAVAHEDRIGLDPDPRVARRQRCAMLPVGHGPPPVEEPGCAEQERPGADRSDPACPFGPRTHPGDQGGVGARRKDSGPARNHQRIHRHVVARQRLGHQPQARRGGQVRIARRDHPRHIRLAHAAMLVGGREDLERPRHVEELHRREGQYLHDPRGTWRKTRALCHSRQSVTR